MEVSNRYIVVKSHIDDAPKQSHFELKTEAFSLDPGSDADAIIIKNLYVSIDPYHINRMRSSSSSHKSISFAAPVTPGEAVDAIAVGKVVASGNPKFAKGDLVVGVFTWAEYSLVKEVSIINKLDNSEFPLTYHIGVLGFSGLTAYAGFFEVCKPLKGESLCISSFWINRKFGRTICKTFGLLCRWLCWEPEKVALLKEKLGFDDAFNYKEDTDLKSTLKRYFPDGIDIYFDNVGAEMLEAAVDNMNTFGRFAVCGVMAEYTDPRKRAAPEMLNIVYKRITVRGFLAADFMNVFPDFLSKTSDYLRAGTLQALEDISYGVENIPSAFVGLFNGENIGKKIVKIADD